MGKGNRWYVTLDGSRRFWFPEEVTTHLMTFADPEGPEGVVKCSIERIHKLPAARIVPLSKSAKKQLQERDNAFPDLIDPERHGDEEWIALDREASDRITVTLKPNKVSSKKRKLNKATSDSTRQKYRMTLVEPIEHMMSMQRYEDEVVVYFRPELIELWSPEQWELHLRTVKRMGRSRKSALRRQAKEQKESQDEHEMES